MVFFVHYVVLYHVYQLFKVLSCTGVAVAINILPNLNPNPTLQYNKVLIKPFVMWVLFNIGRASAVVYALPILNMTHITNGLFRTVLPGLRYRLI